MRAQADRTAWRRAILVGNSVSMPPAPNVQSYPDRLATLLDTWQLTTIIRSGATIEEMEPDVLAALDTHPNAVVVQVGINECAPRPLGVIGRERLGRLRPLWLRQRIIGVIHRWRPQIIRMRPLAQFMTLDRFQASVTRIARAAREKGAAVLLLPITEVTSVAEMRTPFTNREVARYNRALQSAAGGGVAWTDVSTLFPDLTPDDYCHAPETVHWSATAHQRVAEYIAQWLDSLP